MSAPSHLKRFLPLNSLVGRFVFASLVLLPLFIFLSGTLLSNAFEHSQIKAEKEKLQAQLYLLLSLTEVENENVLMPEALTEPRFNQQDSGLYGFIYDDKGKELWRSTSARLLNNLNFNLTIDFEIGNKNTSTITVNNNQKLNSFSYDIEWIDEKKNILPLRFVITSDNKALKAELKGYQKRLWQWLSLMGLLLIVAQMLIMRWGLQPLKHLSTQLNELQENEIQQLSDDYPKEIQPVTESFNEILAYEKKQRERYRNTMSDLAHSLKTPLAVIQSEIDNRIERQTENAKQSSSIHDQIDRINQIISHQLKRAVIRVNQNTALSHTNKISVHTMVNRLSKILNKVYADKNMIFKNQVDKEFSFFGDEADLLEVMGNLLDNACKYGKGSVTVSGNIQQEGTHKKGEKKQRKKNKTSLSICISDNGPGIPDALKKTLLARGSRGDTAQAGQGIGLSVAVDIISSYGGGLELTNNALAPHLSGACFCITFPNMG
jgi:two-component system sensor histidine kinase PhoQ